MGHNQESLIKNTQVIQIKMPSLRHLQVLTVQYEGDSGDGYWRIFYLRRSCLTGKAFFSPSSHHRQSSDFVRVPDSHICCLSNGTSVPNDTMADIDMGRTVLLILFFPPPLNRYL